MALKLERVFKSAFFPVCAAVLAACSGTNESNSGGSGPGSGNATSVGGHASGGSAAGGVPNGSGGGIASGGVASPGGGANPGGTVGSGGAASGGIASGGTASGGTSAGGGKVGSGGTTTGTGGKAAGGSAGAAGARSGGAGGVSAGGSTSTGGTPGAASAEDEGADCQVGTLPDANALTTNAKLPDPFTKLNGMRMTTKAEWRCRREEIRKLAEKFVYGEKPAKPATVTGTVSSTNITVNVSQGGKSSSFSATVSLPTGTGPFPAVVVLGGLGADTATIKAAGAAIINYDPYAVGMEGTPRNNKQGAFYTIYGNTSTTGLLAAWGWGVSRIIDVIAASNGSVLKADAVGVTGCSRFGKGAFIIGVLDQRIALTMPIESGTAGVPILRGVNAEGAQTLASAYGEQPWFGDAFNAFTGGPTKLPIDTHEMVAMVAPRGLFIMENPHIANLGPKSGHVAALGGAEVYKALGAGDAITYWSDIQDGNHCAIRPEWKDPLTKNIKRFLVKTGNDPGVFRPSAKATGNLADWRDWTTPTLN